MGKATTRPRSREWVEHLTIQFQADADLNHAVVTAIRRKEPAISFTSAADAKLEGIPDPEVLEMAAAQERILITHDRQTMPEHFRERLAQGKSSPGVLPETTTPLSISLALITESAEQTTPRAANIGGDSDSVASMGSAIAGALHPETVNEEWYQAVMSINHYDLVALAISLADLQPRA